MDSGSDDTRQRQTVAQLLKRLSQALAEAKRAQTDTRRLQRRLELAEGLIEELKMQLAEGQERAEPDAG